MRKSAHRKFLDLGDYLLTDKYPHKQELLDFLDIYDQNICWVFGDSFMDWYYGYLRHYLEKYNKKAIILARGGTGVEYTYLKYREVEHLIKPHHAALVGISASTRSYFNGFHINSDLKINPPTIHIYNGPVKESERFQKAVNLYYLELYNMKDRDTITEGLVENLCHRVTSRTDRAIIIPTVHTYEALDNKPSIVDIMRKWMQPGNIPQTHNHWLEDEEYMTTFYNHYDSIFEKWN